MILSYDSIFSLFNVIIFRVLFFDPIIKEGKISCKVVRSLTQGLGWAEARQTGCVSIMYSF
eukprot:SAG22_NODE_2_length_61565_cov_858.782010_64_plen_61_part_00